MCGRTRKWTCQRSKYAKLNEKAKDVRGWFGVLSIADRGLQRRRLTHSKKMMQQLRKLIQDNKPVGIRRKYAVKDLRDCNTKMCKKQQARDKKKQEAGDTTKKLESCGKKVEDLDQAIFMSSAVQAEERAGPARRRRERRLRQWLRHGRMTVATVLSEAYHHMTSKPALLKKVLEAEKYLAGRGPNTERAAGNLEVAETIFQERFSKSMEGLPLSRGFIEAVEVAQISPERIWSTSLSKCHKSATKNASRRREWTSRCLQSWRKSWQVYLSSAIQNEPRRRKWTSQYLRSLRKLQQLHIKKESRRTERMSGCLRAGWLHVNECNSRLSR